MIDKIKGVVHSVLGVTVFILSGILFYLIDSRRRLKDALSRARMEKDIATVAGGLDKAQVETSAARKELNEALGDYNNALDELRPDRREP